jgi:hypothetical protein
MFSILKRSVIALRQLTGSSHTGEFAMKGGKSFHVAMFRSMDVQHEIDECPFQVERPLEVLRNSGRRPILAPRVKSRIPRLLAEFPMGFGSLVSEVFCQSMTGFPDDRRIGPQTNRTFRHLSRQREGSTRFSFLYAEDWELVG